MNNILGYRSLQSTVFPLFSPTQFVNVASDFDTTVSSAGNPPWQGTATGSGTIASGTSTANHPGTVAISCTTSANSGYVLGLSTTYTLLAGNEVSNAILTVTNTTDTKVKFGFFDVYSVSDPVDAACIAIDGTTLTGKTSSNSTLSTTGTSYTITAGVWYNLKVYTNADATKVTFEVYDSPKTQLLWSDSLTANIPTGAGRLTGHGVSMYSTGTTAQVLGSVDYMDLSINRTLSR